eukprot:TRINITY_DN44273_c0_g1_i2.p2 TRINITY_DN44273_c0_g1~~TRINITY_DN44273_c0_g1_i2.p2  ORF type:complete len:138 (+),score=34.63 TRINITY_DN44273_c0_g1_i2:139-552(+)
MPHGDMSDLGAIVMIAGGIQSTFYPALCFSTYAPLKPFFDGPSSPELETMIRIVGGFLLILGCMLFTVRWNTINGKLSGLACIGCGANIAYTTFHLLDKEVFVLRPFYIYAAVLALTGLHLMFNANAIKKDSHAKTA